MSRQSLNRFYGLRIDAETAIVVLASRHDRENIVYMMGAGREPEITNWKWPFKFTTMSPTHQTVPEPENWTDDENRNLRLKTET